MIKQVLNENGSFFLNLGSSLKNPQFPFDVLFVCLKHFHLQNTFHWIKSISLDLKEGTISKGHFKPINSDRFVNDCHEYIFHFTKTGNVKIDRKAIGVGYSDISNIKRWKSSNNQNLRCRGNNWFIPYKTVQQKKDHPCPFPLTLPLNCIKLQKKSNLIVLDPFVGSGQTGLAAAKSGKVTKFIGFDIDQNYINISEQKIKNEIKKEA